jgi:NitT/TauT family transport system ATP-binding protein
LAGAHVSGQQDWYEMIKANNVTKIFPGARGLGEVVALQDISFEVASGELATLLGASGCGKTTMLNIIAGFEKPSKGVIEVDGKMVDRPSPQRGVIFQQPALFPWLNVIENVLFGPLAQGKSRKEMEQKAMDLLHTVKLDGFIRHHPFELSGGMMQRVAIARVLINDPQVLLMDEPFGALDAQTRMHMQEYLMEIHETFKKTIVFVTHDIDEAIFISDRILIFTPRPGRIVDIIKVEYPRPRNHVFLTTEIFTNYKRRALDYLWSH